MTTGQSIGLALSGGGFRAALFHLGAVWRLNELSLLPKIDRISAVSGGAILSGLLAVRWGQGRLNFSDDGVVENFREEVVNPVWDFCSRNLDVVGVLGSFLPFTNLMARAYRRHLVGGLTLQDMPDTPDFVFNAAHLETGRNWTFSKSCMRTYKLGAVDRPDILLATAIAASSAFPPWFSPVVLKLDPDRFRKTELAELFDRVDLKKKVSLTDGGLYDNIGIHAIRNFKTILVSDASSPLTPREGRSAFRWMSHRINRPVDIAVEQTRALRRIDLMRQLTETKTKTGAFWMISADMAEYPSGTPFRIGDEWKSRFKGVRTRLNSFSHEEKARLVNWGYTQADASIRSHYLTNARLPEALLFPEFSFDSPPPL